MKVLPINVNYVYKSFIKYNTLTVDMPIDFTLKQLTQTSAMSFDIE